MTFPQTILDTVVELYIDGAWTDITSKVYSRDSIVITRGRSDEGAKVDRSTCRLTLNNRDGRFSPRNPTGTYYGKIGRNTKLRVSVRHGSVFMDLPGGSGDQATTPDAAALDITGDIDVRLEAKLNNWYKSINLAGKWETTGNQKSWVLWISASGLLVLSWTTAGTIATLTSVEATEELPGGPGGHKAVRATLDVNNGSGGNTVTFYYADTIAGPWTQLGNAVVTVGVTSIFSSSAILELGDVDDVAVDAPQGRVYKFELRNGIGGSAVANPDFTAQSAGASSFADGAGRTWTLQGHASITNKRIRFVGEVPEWPPKWDITGTDVWVPIEASGIMRRLGQGATPLKSALYRALTTLATPPVAYWPMEDESGSTLFGSALGGPPMKLQTSTRPDAASYSDFAASAPIPILRNAQIGGSILTYTGTGFIQVRFIMNIPSTGTTNGAIITSIRVTGTAYRWDLVYGTGGTLALKAYDSTTTLILDTGGIAFAVNGKNLRVNVQLSQSGSDVGYTFSTLEAGETSGSTSSGTLASYSVSRCIAVFMSSGVMDDVAIGHLSVQKEITSLFDVSALELAAFVGEASGDRVARLCEEEDIDLYQVWDSSESVTMGAQSRSTLLTMLREVGDTDLGILYEPRDMFGLAYRMRAGIYNQDAVLTLDYSSHEMSTLEPTDDDQAIANDVTVVRTGGSSDRQVLETGALSIQDPPNGVGTYDVSVTINPESDDDLPDQAGWRLHLGTVDEARYPRIEMELASNEFDSNLRLNAMELDVGDLLVIENPPSWLPPDDIEQIAQGFTETLSQYQHKVVVNCSPASPWRVGIYDETGNLGSRYSSDGSTLNEAMTTTETDMDVATTSGPLWTTDAGEMPFDILVGGERMTVTAISGASSPQTFTVTRSVNGVVKTHSSGAAVTLFRPAIYAL